MFNHHSLVFHSCLSWTARRWWPSTRCSSWPAWWRCVAVVGLWLHVHQGHDVHLLVDHKCVKQTEHRLVLGGQSSWQNCWDAGCWCCWNLGQNTTVDSRITSRQAATWLHEHQKQWKIWVPIHVRELIAPLTYLGEHGSMLTKGSTVNRRATPTRGYCTYSPVFSWAGGSPNWQLGTWLQVWIMTAMGELQIFSVNHQRYHNEPPTIPRWTAKKCTLSTMKCHGESLPNLSPAK